MYSSRTIYEILGYQLCSAYESDVSERERNGKRNGTSRKSDERERSGEQMKGKTFHIIHRGVGRVLISIFLGHEP